MNLLPFLSFAQNDRLSMREYSIVHLPKGQYTSFIRRTVPFF